MLTTNDCFLEFVDEILHSSTLKTFISDPKTQDENKSTISSPKIQSIYEQELPSLPSIQDNTMQVQNKGTQICSLPTNTIPPINILNSQRVFISQEQVKKEPKGKFPDKLTGDQSQ